MNVPARRRPENYQGFNFSKEITISFLTLIQEEKYFEEFYADNETLDFNRYTNCIVTNSIIESEKLEYFLDHQKLEKVIIGIKGI